RTARVHRHGRRGEPGPAPPIPGPGRPDPGHGRHHPGGARHPGEIPRADDREGPARARRRLRRRRDVRPGGPLTAPRDVQEVTMSSRALLKFAPVAAIAVVAGLFTIPAAGRSFTPTSPKALEQLSQAPVIRYYLAHPGQAPAALRDRLRAVAGMKAKLAARWAPPLSPPVNDRFNLDTVGLPQNEESVGMCKGATNWLIEGTNDYRGLLFGVDGTGWHYSNNGGVSVQNEGVLPPITLSGGESRPSGG